MVMQVDTERMISITKLQKGLTGKLRKLTNDAEPLFVMRNNDLAAVIMSPAKENDGKMKGNRREHRGRNDGAPSRSLPSS